MFRSLLPLPLPLPSSPSSLLKSLRSLSTAPNLFLSLLNHHFSNATHLFQIHGFMVPRGLHQDNLFLCRFIDACSSLGLFDYAYLAFSQKEQPNIHLYNTMIRAFSQSDSAEKAVILYNKIQVAGLRPDTYSFPFLLKAVSRLSVTEIGREVHCQVICIGLELNVHVVTALVQMYSSCGCVSDARKLFDGMPFRDLALWNAMVAGYAKGMLRLTGQRRR